MPGPVSDSYDPEFGTGANAELVESGIREVLEKVSTHIGSDERLPILDVVVGDNKPHWAFGGWRDFSKRELRIIRFCLNRALESI